MKPTTAFHDLNADRDAALGKPASTRVAFDIEAHDLGVFSARRYQKDAAAIPFVATMDQVVAQSRCKEFMPFKTGVDSFKEGLALIALTTPCRAQRMRDDLYARASLGVLSSYWGASTRRFPQPEREAIDIRIDPDFAPDARTEYVADFTDLERRVNMHAIYGDLFAPYSKRCQQDIEAERRLYVLPKVPRILAEFAEWAKNNPRMKAQQHDVMQRRGGGKGTRAMQRKFRNQFIK